MKLVLKWLTYNLIFFFPCCCRQKISSYVNLIFAISNLTIKYSFISSSCLKTIRVQLAPTIVQNKQNFSKIKESFLCFTI